MDRSGRANTRDADLDEVGTALPHECGQGVGGGVQDALLHHRDYQRQTRVAVDLLAVCQQLRVLCGLFSPALNALEQPCREPEGLGTRGTA